MYNSKLHYVRESIKQKRNKLLFQQQTSNNTFVILFKEFSRIIWVYIDLLLHTTQLDTGYRVTSPHSALLVRPALSSPSPILGVGCMLPAHAPYRTKQTGSPRLARIGLYWTNSCCFDISRVLLQTVLAITSLSGFPANLNFSREWVEISNDQ